MSTTTKEEPVTLLTREEVRCFNCGQNGHLAKNCRGEKKSLKCYGCQKMGHIARNCPERNRDNKVMNERKQNKKEKNKEENNRVLMQIEALTKEVAALKGQSTSSEEHLFIQEDLNKRFGVDFYPSLLCNDHTSYNTKRRKKTIEIVVDTGGGSHSFLTREAFILMNRQRGARFTGYNKHAQPVESKGIGTINVQVVKVDGSLHTMVINNVNYCPSGAANILKPQILLENGWDTTRMLHGYIVDPNGEHIKVRRNKHNHPVIDMIIAQKHECYLQKEGEQLVRDNKSILEEFHERLGHCDIRLLGKMIGVPVPKEFHCSTCKICKIKRHTIKKEGTYTARKALEKVYVDIFGPCKTTGYRGRRYIICFVDAFTKVKKFFTMERKGQAGEKLKEYIQEMGIPETLRCDNAKEFLGGIFGVICKERGIRREYSAPYTPQQNGVAERSWRTLMGMVRCMLLRSKLPKTLWPLAVKHAEDVLNSLPRATIKKEGKKRSVSHIELWNSESYLGRGKHIKVHLDDAHIMTWGAPYAVLKEGIRVTEKLDPKGELCYYLGEDWKRNSKVFIRKDFRTIFSCRNYTALLKEPMIIEPKTKENIIIMDESTEVSECQPPQSTVQHLNSEVSTEEGPSQEGSNSQDSAGNDHTTPLMERNYCDIHTDNILENRLRRVANLYTCTEKEPKNFKEATQGKSRNEWTKAIIDELSTLIDMGTFRKVKKKSWMNILRLKHVFKLKRNQEGKIVRHKDRCVVQGCRQIKGIDYFKTRSNVLRKETFRFLCSMAVNTKATIYQADIKNAYPLSKLEEMIFVDQPEGVEFLDDAKKAIIQLKDDEVLQLLRSLYGLKQAGRNWEKLLSQILKKKGFMPCKSDPCLYINKANMKQGKGVLAVGTYVDDLPVLSTSLEEYQIFIRDLKKEIPVVDLGEAKWFLSVEVKQHENKIELSQQREIEETYNQVKGSIGCQNWETPMETKIYNVPDEEQSGKLSDQEKYRSLIGSLLYISEWTRPDLSFSVSYLSRKLGKATSRDMKYLLRVLKFAYDTRDKTLKFIKTDKRAIVGYTDSDWGNDQRDRKSQSGYLLYIHGNLCSWKSAKQDGVALSSANAEYVALSEGAREGIYFQNLLNECYGKKEQVYLYCDNTGAKKNAENELQHKRSKHIDIRYHFIKDEVEKENISVEWINTEENLADIMTKPVSKKVHQGMCNRIFISGER